MRWYADKEVSMDSIDEVEHLVGRGCKAILMDIVLAISLKVHSLKKAREQESVSLKEGSSLHPMKQGRSLTSQLHHTREYNWNDSYGHTYANPVQLEIYLIYI